MVEPITTNSSELDHDGNKEIAQKVTEGDESHQGSNIEQIQDPDLHQKTDLDSSYPTTNPTEKQVLIRNRMTQDAFSSSSEELEESDESERSEASAKDTSEHSEYSSYESETGSEREEGEKEVYEEEEEEEYDDGVIDENSGSSSKDSDESSIVDSNAGNFADGKTGTGNDSSINSSEADEQSIVDELEEKNRSFKSDFMQQAESLVLDEILEQSAMPHPSSPDDLIPQNKKKWSSKKKHSSSFSSSYSKSKSSKSSTEIASSSNVSSTNPAISSSKDDELSGGMLPDVLTTVRQKIESMTLFDSDLMRQIGKDFADLEDEEARRSKENLRRVFQQSISASILVSLSHKRYERRRNAAMEIEKVVRSLVQEKELERVRAVLIFLSEDFVRSTSEDARKGGVVALAACGIGLKKADESDLHYTECKDLILASVVHACQDHNQRVRYYATESLFNVIKVLPALAVQHFFILFEILRSLYADVDIDVRSGAQLLDKKLKEIIVAAINNGSFTTEACIPLFSRFVHMRNKATKRLTLTWLQEFSEKLVGSPMVGFLHLVLGGVFAMLADPNASIRQGSLVFLETILPQLLGNNEDFEDSEASLYVDFDKILQSIVTTMEHPDPFVRKVAMYWMNQIIQTHLVDHNDLKNTDNPENKTVTLPEHLTTASISVRNSLPHVLPGVLLSIGDQFNNRSTNKDMFLPGLTTRSLAEQTNEYFENAVKRDGKSYVSHLDGFIVALREELDSPGGLATRSPQAIERQPFRLDVKSDGTGIESTGWFRSSDSGHQSDESLMMSRLCALQWIIVLYENVVPHSLKAEYAKEFISPIIHQLIENPPEQIVIMSFEVLAKITTPLENKSSTQTGLDFDVDLEGLPVWAKTVSSRGYKKHTEKIKCEVMNERNIDFALDIMDSSKRILKSRDREVFAALIHLFSRHHRLLTDLARIIKIMCKLQPAEFVFVSFAVELDNFVSNSWTHTMQVVSSLDGSTDPIIPKQNDFARDLEFVSCFVQQMNNVLLVAPEANDLRLLLLESIGNEHETEESERRATLFQILLQSFAHNLASTTSLCLWGGAFFTLSCCFQSIEPMDMDLLFYLEFDQLIEMLERPIFRHLHLRMLEIDNDPSSEGSGAMLFRTLKSILMLLPQSTSYAILKDRLLAVSKFRQSSIFGSTLVERSVERSRTNMLIERIKEVRKMHCDAKWRSVRAESLEPVLIEPSPMGVHIDENKGRREWLGYSTEKEEKETKDRMKKLRNQKIPHKEGYDEFSNMEEKEQEWKSYWIQNAVD